jgi:hypothetical protein
LVVCLLWLAAKTYKGANEIYTLLCRLLQANNETGTSCFEIAFERALKARSLDPVGRAGGSCVTGDLSMGGAI